MGLAGNTDATNIWTDEPSLTVGLGHRRASNTLIAWTINATQTRIQAVSTRGKFNSRIWPVMAVALMLWCAGTGCVLVRSAQATNLSAGDSALTDSVNAGEMGASQHAACHAKQAQKTRKASRSRPQLTRAVERNTPRPGQSDAMSCCPLANGLFVTSSRGQMQHDAGIIAINDSTSLALTNSSSAPLDVPLRLPNQHHLYLRGCAFLI